MAAGGAQAAAAAAAAAPVGEPVDPAVRAVEGWLARCDLGPAIVEALKAALPGEWAPRLGERPAQALLRVLRSLELGAWPGGMGAAQLSALRVFLVSSALQELLHGSGLSALAVWARGAAAAIPAEVGGGAGGLLAQGGARGDGALGGAETTSVAVRGTSFSVFCALPPGLVVGLHAEAVLGRGDGLPEAWGRMVEAVVAARGAVEEMGGGFRGVSHRLLVGAGLRFAPPPPRVQGPGFLCAVPFLAPALLAEGELESTARAPWFSVPGVWRQVTEALHPLPVKLVPFIEGLAARGARAGKLKTWWESLLPSADWLEGVSRCDDARARALMAAGLVAPDVQLFLKVAAASAGDVVPEEGEEGEGAGAAVSLEDAEFAAAVKAGRLGVGEADAVAIPQILRILSRMHSPPVGWGRLDAALRADWARLEERGLVGEDGVRRLARLPRLAWRRQAAPEVYGATWRDMAVVERGGYVSPVQDALWAAWSVRCSLGELGQRVEDDTAAFVEDQAEVGRLALAAVAALFLATGGVAAEPREAIAVAVAVRRMRATGGEPAPGGGRVQAGTDSVRAREHGRARGGGGRSKGRGRASGQLRVKRPLEPAVAEPAAKRGDAEGARESAPVTTAEGDDG
jgi:hypothetical protein